MLTEYVGELVRPPVADARERKVYNMMVGAGTYVFALNEQFCVDATRQGMNLLPIPSIPIPFKFLHEGWHLKSQFNSVFVAL
jgi:hypothetical protein